LAKLKIATSTVGAIASAVTEIVKLISRWLGSSDIRRMAKAIRLGDRIVNRLKDLEIDDKKLNKYLRKWDKYNN